MNPATSVPAASRRGFGIPEEFHRNYSRNPERVFLKGAQPRLRNCRTSKAFDQHVGVGGEEWPFIAADTDVLVEPGMVLAVEAPYYVRGVGGFIIEDQPQSLSVDRGHDRVDMYGYVSMIVAAMQVQEKEIASLRKELEETKGGACSASRTR